MSELVRNYETKNIIKGKHPKIQGCKGPLVDYKGTERSCCLNCYSIRNCISRDNNKYLISTNPNVLDYLEMISSFIEEVYTAFSISTCDDISPVIVYSSDEKLELDFSSYNRSFYKQIKVLHKQGILIDNYTPKNFALTERSIPIFIPDDDYEFRSSYGGDEGVEFKYITAPNGEVFHLFRTTNDSLARKSGKWYHLIKYYEILVNVFDVKKRIIKKIAHQDGTSTEYFVIPKDFIEEDKITYTSKKPDLKNIIPAKDEIINGMPNDKYVVVDLDSTLIFSTGYDITEKPIINDRTFYIKLISQKLHYRVVIRKHVYKFLNELKDKGYKIIIWSAGWKDYVDRIVSQIFKDIDFVYVFNRSHIDSIGYKDLSKISDYITNFKLENCRLIDDKNIHVTNQEKNVILVKVFKFKDSFPADYEDDDELETLSDVVEKSFLEN